MSSLQQRVKALKSAYWSARTDDWDRPCEFGRCTVKGEPDIYYQVDIRFDEVLAVMTSPGNFYCGPVPREVVEAAGFSYKEVAAPLRFARDFTPVLQVCLGSA